MGHGNESSCLMVQEVTVVLPIFPYSRNAGGFVTVDLLLMTRCASGEIDVGTRLTGSCNAIQGFICI